MSAVERVSASRLSELEDAIERGLATTFVDVGRALKEIRDGRLYRDTHKTFELYLRERWDLSRSYAHRLIDAAEHSEMLPTGNKPGTEREARRQISAEVATRPTAPQPSEVAELVGHVEDLDRLRNKISSKKAAARLHIRSRAAFAKRLRRVGTYLGSIALSIEEQGEK